MAAAMAAFLGTSAANALQFDFERIEKEAREYTVTVDARIEISFGRQSTEALSRKLGAVVDESGLIVFDGADVNSDDPFSLMSGMTVNAEPKSIEVEFMDGRKYPAEYIGIDRFTKLAFCRIKAGEKAKFRAVDFKKRDDFQIGDWLATFLQLPKFISPPVAADVGMVSAIIESPERFVFIVGFSEFEIGSILYDSTGEPIGILGSLEDAALSGFEAATMPSFSDAGGNIPLLGIIGAEKLHKLFKNPPVKGKVDRGWLGIYMQALTPDIADFWRLQTEGGIIINEVVKDSPADAAGLRTGDIILRLNGRTVTVKREEDLPIFQREIVESGAGSKIDFQILRRRDGTVDTLEATATLTQAPLTPSEADDYEDKNFELTVRDMVFADYNYFKLDRREFQGVVVKEVEPGGWAAVGGISPGDIIQSIGGGKINSVKDAERIFKKLSESKPKEVVFFIWRDNKTQFVNVKTEW
jgi:serine protease Do